MQNLQLKQDDDSNDKLKTIVISKKNYDRLKALGFCGDSFNTAIGRLLEQVEGI